MNNAVSDYCLLLRVVAAHLVVIGHAASYFGVLGFTQWPSMPYVQSVAVIVFFFLSGFTIAWLCDFRKNLSGYTYQHFIIDRFCRIFIPLLPVLLVYAVLEYLFYGTIPHPYPDSYNLDAFVSNALLITPQPFPSAPFGTNRPLWSIAQEWWLYVSYGVVALGISSGKAYVRISLFCLFLFSLCFTITDILGGGKDLGIVWFLGVIAWKSISFKVFDRLSVYWIFLTFLVALLLLLAPSVWPRDGTYTLLWNILVSVPLFFSFLIAARFNASFICGSFKGVIEYMGAYSYTLYLSHYPIMEFFYRAEYFLSAPWLGFFISCGLAMLVTYLLASVFEFRYKIYRNYLWGLLGKSASNSIR